MNKKCVSYQNRCKIKDRDIMYIKCIVVEHAECTWNKSKGDLGISAMYFYTVLLLSIKILLFLGGGGGGGEKSNFYWKDFVLRKITVWSPMS